MMLQTVYGSLMHHSDELQALGDAAHQQPYIAPPKAPVLYIKPANTFSHFDARIALPMGSRELRARACVGLFFKENWPIAGIKSAQSATELIANASIAFGLLCDFTLPHDSFHRPPVKFNAFDGSLALPAAGMHLSATALQDLQIETWVNDRCTHIYRSADWLCSAEQQLVAVNAFIAFEAGDVLMLGCPPNAPLVKEGDVVETRVGHQVFTRSKIIGQVIP
jgi:5-oxopent-3-ene-1,2,5-tricarboxylate decarboxylase / 2-hydroxyhepta-2,4-diene-1,7-dioate isomerase